MNNLYPCENEAWWTLWAETLNAIEKNMIGEEQMQENLFKIGDKFNLPDSNDTFEITAIGAVHDGELRYTGRRTSPLGSYCYTSYSCSHLLHDCIQTVWAEDADALDDIDGPSEDMDGLAAWIPNPRAEGFWSIPEVDPEHLQGTLFDAKPMPSDWWEIYYANFIKQLAEVFPTPVIFGTPKVCECGMEKHNFANHSTWCPKHE